MSRLDHNYTDVTSAYSFQTVSSLNHYHDCLLAFKTTHNYFNSDVLNNLFFGRHITYNLRNHRVLQEEIQNSNFDFYSTVNWLKRSWNLLPRNITSISNIILFKRSLNSLVTSF